MEESNAVRRCLVISLANTLEIMNDTIKAKIITEHWGESNQWTIYEFDNGFAFAFRQWQGQLTNYSSFNGWNGYKDEYNLPKNKDGTPLFKSIDYIDYQMRIGNGFTLPAYTNSSRNTGQNTENCTILAVSSASGTQDSWVSLQIYGRWK